MLCINPVDKGQDHQTVKRRIAKATECALSQNMEIIGIGADGDSKFRKYYFQGYKQNDVNEKKSHYTEL